MDKKGIAALLIGKPMGGPAADDAKEDDSGGKSLGQHMESSAKEMLAAIKADDAAALGRCFQTMSDVAAGAAESPEEEAAESPEEEAAEPEEEEAAE
jgi:hypothetical protein